MTKKVKLTVFSSELTRTEEQFAANDTVYASEIVCITDGGDNDGRVKVTDGIHTWSELEYEPEAESTGGAPSGAAGGALAGTYPNPDLDPEAASTDLDAASNPFLRTSAQRAVPLDAMWSQINNAGSPSAGEFEASSNSDATAVTSLTFHILDAGTNDQSAWFASMRIGGLLTGRQTNNNGTNASGSPCIYRIIDVPTLASSRYTIAVAYVSGAFIGSFPNWYVSYAGNEQTQWYNDKAVQLQEATITGVISGGAGRFAYDMSAAPYSWTNVRGAWAIGNDGAAAVVYNTPTGANTGQFEFTDIAGNVAPDGTSVTILLKGI